MNNIKEKIKDSREYIAVGIFAVILAVFGGKELKDELLGDGTLDPKATQDIEKTIDDIVNNDSAFDVAGYKFSFKAETLKKEHFLENVYSLLAYFNDKDTRFEARYGGTLLFSNEDNLDDEQIRERLDTLLKVDTLESIGIYITIPDHLVDIGDLDIAGIKSQAVLDGEAEYVFEKMKEDIQKQAPGISLSLQPDLENAIRSIDLTFVNTNTGTYVVVASVTTYPIVNDSGTVVWNMKISKDHHSIWYTYSHVRSSNQSVQIPVDSYRVWKAKQRQSDN